MGTLLAIVAALAIQDRAPVAYRYPEDGRESFEGDFGAAAGYPGQPSHPVGHGVGARAHEPPYCHLAVPGLMRSGMVLAIEPGIYWEGGGGLRLEDNFLVTPVGCEKLCSYPDDFRV